MGPLHASCIGIGLGAIAFMLSQRGELACQGDKSSVLAQLNWR